MALASLGISRRTRSDSRLWHNIEIRNRDYGLRLELKSYRAQMNPKP